MRFRVVSFLALSACSSTSVDVAPASAEDAGPDAAPPPPACEADTKTDRENCGACGNKCDAEKICRGGACLLESAFAIRKLFFGESDRQGNPDSLAWRKFGRNIDGMVSTATPNGECMKVAGTPSSAFADGDDGIDNSWGRNVLPMLLAFTSTPSQMASNILEGGEETIAIVGADWSAPADVAALKGGVITAEPFPGNPKWDGTDARKMSFFTMESGAPKAKFASGSVVGRVFDSGVLTSSIALRIGASGAFIVIPIHKPRVTMTIAADGKAATDGILSGIVPREQLVDAIAKLSGFFSSDLCSGSTIEGIKQSIRQAADILVDGTQDPLVECDGISFGMGFDAGRIVATDIGLPGDVESVDPCQP